MQYQVTFQNKTLDIIESESLLDEAAVMAGYKLEIAIGNIVCDEALPFDLAIEQVE